MTFRSYSLFTAARKAFRAICQAPFSHIASAASGSSVLGLRRSPVRPGVFDPPSHECRLLAPASVLRQGAREGEPTDGAQIALGKVHPSGGHGHFSIQGQMEVPSLRSVQQNPRVQPHHPQLRSGGSHLPGGPHVLRPPPQADDRTWDLRPPRTRPAPRAEEAGASSAGLRRPRNGRLHDPAGPGRSLRTGPARPPRGCVRGRHRWGGSRETWEIRGFWSGRR